MVSSLAPRSTDVGLDGDPEITPAVALNLPGIAGRLWVSALDYAQCAIANVDFSRLPLSSKKVCGYIGMRIASGEEFDDERFACSISMVISSPDFKP